eukprot:TRINITY_DN4383_c0_g1_i1.p1 TRINITY_DN4383_c0_g1~~TRINITY_DN4383_c0_g1_i1.p1  ORF type:complete len:431 (-),score=93.65 TRINITY_DN4383_c0_g1_i1:43-1335(-)
MEFFHGVNAVPLDPILGIQILYNDDPLPDQPVDGRPFKLNLGVGTYRGSDGKPMVLEVVKKVERELADSELHEKVNKDYLPVEGLAQFRTESAKLLLGEEGYESNKDRMMLIQTLSGTGALRMGASLITKFMPRTVYLPLPSYRNHKTIFTHGGDPIAYYRYLKPTGELDLQGMLEDLRVIPPGSVVLLHMCAHNPSGIDPNKEEWTKIADVIQECHHLAFFDCAYLGFASGDVCDDAFPPRLFLSRGMQFMAALSYSKNMSLYSERVGLLCAVTANETIAHNLLSQAKHIARGAYSNPPSHGARIAAAILTNPQYKAQWLAEVRTMVERIQKVRKCLYELLVEYHAPGDWSLVTKQRGLFSLLPITEEQVLRLRSEHHIYMCLDGRSNLAGLADDYVGHFAKALAAIVGTVQGGQLRISRGHFTIASSQ